MGKSSCRILHLGSEEPEEAYDECEQVEPFVENVCRHEAWMKAVGRHAWWEGKMAGVRLHDLKTLKHRITETLRETRKAQQI